MGSHIVNRRNQVVLPPQRSRRRAPSDRTLWCAGLLALASAVTSVALPHRAHADEVTTLVVTTDSPGGPGSLSEAFELASSDPSISTIDIRSANADLDASVTYSGSQHLTIEGNGARVVGWSQEPGIAIRFDTSADITINDLEVTTVAQSGLGFFPVSDSTRAVRLELSNIDVFAPATGIRIHDERDDARLAAVLDDVDLDTGDMTLDATNLNGGTLAVSYRLGDIRGRFGPRVSQNGAGSSVVSLEFLDIDVESEGFLLEDYGDGDLRADLAHLQVTAGRKIGTLHDNGVGHILADIRDVTGFGSWGLRLDERGPGNLRAFVDDYAVRLGTKGWAIDATEQDGGALRLNVSNSSVGSYKLVGGIRAVQADGGRGFLTVTDTDFGDLLGEPLHLEGIDEVYAMGNTHGVYSPPTGGAIGDVSVDVPIASRASLK